MARTAVGLFLDGRVAEEVIRDLEASGFARQDVHVVDEAFCMIEPGAMSIAHIHFEADLIRMLRSIGASEVDAECYVEGLRRGVRSFSLRHRTRRQIEVMNRHNPAEAEELAATAPHLSGEHRAMFHDHAAATQSGRVRSSGGGASLFVW